MWRFIREMEPGDLVAVPQKGQGHCYVAEVTGPAYHDPAKVDEGAFRREARWLNGKKAIRRQVASGRLQEAFRRRITCTRADDELLRDIRTALAAADGSPGSNEESGPRHRRGRSPRQSNIEMRQEVERVAQQAVENRYGGQGYDVRDVSADNFGWDLEVTRNGRRLKVEVKGLSGATPIAELTPNEYHSIKRHDKSYRLCIVTNVLDKSARRIQEFSFKSVSQGWKDQAGNQLSIAVREAARVEA